MNTPSGIEQQKENPTSNSRQNEEQDDSRNFRITHREIIEYMCNKCEKDSFGLTDNCQKKIIFEFICQKIGVNQDEISSEDLEDLTQTTRNFFTRFLLKYRDPKFSRKIHRVLSDPWAQLCLKIPAHFLNTKDISDSSDVCNDLNWSDISVETNSPRKSQSTPKPRGLKGRKRKPFEAKKRRAQLKDSSIIRATYSQEAIHLANKQNLRLSGKKDASFVVKRMSSQTGRTAKLAKEAILANLSEKSKPLTKKTPEDALFFLLTNNLTKDQYSNMKKSCKDSGADIWPAYSYVQEAKSRLKPENISVDENEAFVPLQDILEHTMNRMLASNPFLLQTMENLAQENGCALEATLFYKIGFDSSGSHKTTQQTNSEGDHRGSNSIMASQMAPLRLVTVIGSDEISLFDYPGPNSPHSCRPLRLAFEKENNTSIQCEFQRLKKEMSEIQGLVVSAIPKITINFSGLFTLLDGKVLCSITGAKTTECPLCHKPGQELARNEGPFDVKSPDFLSYGASILHFGLRAFSTLLQIGYKQDFKSHRVTKQNSAAYEERKLKVKQAFKRELNLIVDSPSSPGNTLSGNTARSAFANPIKFAQIIGVSPMLVSNIDVIWRIMASKYPINGEKFDKLCKETLEVYMSDAGWYNITPTIHKILHHGKDIIEACPVPIGWTSEEGSEANNKFIRKFLANHTRKTSHIDTLTDLFHRLLEISDPILVTKSCKTEKNAKRELTPEMRDILVISEDEEMDESSSSD